MVSTTPLHRFTSKRIAAIVSLFVIGLVSISFIYIGVTNNNGLASFDTSVTQWALEHRTPLLTTIMQLFTHALSPQVLIVITLLGAAFWVWRKKEYWQPGLLVISIGAAFLVSTLIKVIINRARPPEADMALPLETGFSFPSNHVYGIAIFALVLGYLLYTRWPSIRFLTIWIITTSLGVIIMAMSRIYLGYHWLTDVTASVGLALVILALVITIDTYRPLRQSDPNKNTQLGS